MSNSNKKLIYHIDIKCDAQDNEKIRESVLKITISEVEWMESGINVSKDNFGDNVIRIPFKTTTEEQSMEVEDELDDIDDILHYDITRSRFNVEIRDAVDDDEKDSPSSDVGAPLPALSPNSEEPAFALPGLGLQEPSKSFRRSRRVPRPSMSPGPPDMMTLLGSPGTADSAPVAKAKPPKKKKESVLEKQQRERREAEERRQHRAVLEMARTTLLQRKKELDSLLYTLNHALTMSATAIAAAKKKKRKPVLDLIGAAFASDEQPVVGAVMAVEGRMTIDGAERPLSGKDVLIKWFRMPMQVEVGIGGKTYTPVPQDLGCPLRVVISIPSQPSTTDLSWTSKPVELPKDVLEQLNELLSRKGSKRRKVVEFEVETVTSREQRLSSAGGMAGAARMAMLSVNTEKLKYKVGGKTLVRPEHSRGVYAIADELSDKVVHVNFANEMVQTAFWAKSTQERNRIVFVINAFCAHAELSRMLRSEDEERHGAQLSQMAQLLRSGLATVDREIVVLEQEEEEAETPKATAKADVDPPGESGPDPEQQSSRAGSNKTGADQARMQEMLHALHARGTLDARDRVWLSALLKGGACAADLRRSDQDVLEYARHCLRSAMKRNGKRPAPATLEREVAAKFTLTSQHKTDIRQLLSQYTGDSDADLYPPGGTSELVSPESASENPLDLLDAFATSAPQQTRRASAPAQTPSAADDIFSSLGPLFETPEPAKTEDTPPTNTVAFPPADVVATPPAKTVASPPTNTVAFPPADVVATPPAKTVASPPTNTVAFPPATPPADAAATKSLPAKTTVMASDPKLSRSPAAETSTSTTPGNRAANVPLPPTFASPATPSTNLKMRRSTWSPLSQSKASPSSLDLDRSRTKGDYIWDRRTNLWWNPKNKFFFNSKSKQYSRSPKGPFLKFDPATRKLKPV